MSPVLSVGAVMMGAMEHSWSRGRRQAWKYRQRRRADEAEKLMAVWLEEARWVYQDRIGRSEAIHAAASSLVGVFVAVMSLPAAVVALTPSGGMASAVLLIGTAGSCGIGMVLSIISTLRRPVLGKDLARERQAFTRQKATPVKKGAAGDRVEILAQNLMIGSQGQARSIIEAVSDSTDCQIIWYTRAQKTLMLACVLAAATLICLALTS